MNPELKRELVGLLTVSALERVMDALHAKLSKSTELKGRVTIETRDEADALEDLIGKYVNPGRGISIAEVDRLLRENTAFHCSLEEAVVLHRRHPIVRPKVVKAQEAAAREKGVRRCFELLPGLRLSTEAYARVVSWMHAAEARLRSSHRRLGEEELLHAVRTVALVIGRAPERTGTPIYLAELATEVAGDAHALDANRPAGRLLLHALAYHFPETARRERRGSSPWRTNLLSEAGIARDPVSVRVDTFGLMGDAPHLREMRRAALTRSVNLDDLEEFGAEVRAWRETAYIIENPTVFTTLMKHLRATYRVELHPTLICTHGSMNLAAWGLLHALRDAGAELFYAGDFEVKGLEIAAAVLERFPGGANAWRMSVDDYRSALKGSRKTLDPAGLKPASLHFADLVAEMSVRRLTAHQEALIQYLKADLDRFILEHAHPRRHGSDPRLQQPVNAPA